MGYLSLGLKNRLVVNREVSCLGIWKVQSVIYGKGKVFGKDIMNLVWAMLEVPEGCLVMYSSGGLPREILSKEK